MKGGYMRRLTTSLKFLEKCAFEVAGKDKRNKNDTLKADTKELLKKRRVMSDLDRNKRRSKRIQHNKAPAKPVQHFVQQIPTLLATFGHWWTLLEAVVAKTTQHFIKHLLIYH